MASTSHRVSIKWPPAPPSEPTSTLVLTSAKKTFVDVRLLLPTAFPSLPSASDIPEGSSVYWAFSGTSKHDPITGSATWRHSVDSRHPDTTDVVDSGTFETLPNGDVLEKGTMVDFEDRLLKDYEEVWRDDDITKGTECVVLKCMNDSGSQEIGAVVRIGDWCQGILRQGEDVTVERWRKARSVFRTGKGRLPCESAYELQRVGSTMVLDEREWVVNESCVL